jgi:tetratricopeptide (TPR) repeat protein
VVDLLKAYFRLQDGDDHREIREKATGKLLALDRALEPALPAVLSLLDVRVDDPAWTALDPAERRRRTLDAVKALVLREASEQPVLLIVEDLHWVDGETQALLDALVEGLGAARVLLLVNHRPEYEHRWDAKAYCHRLRLDALPAESAAELLDVLLGEDGSLAPLKQLLVRQGNPFFLEETVRTLAETGALAGERGRYRLARPLPAVQVPATVQAILAARIDRLAPEDKGLLQVASVVGKDVPVALLRAAADLPEEALHRGLERLQRAELVYEAALFPDRQYSFTHALTHEVTYGGLLRERRCALHDRVLEALEQAAGGRAHEEVEQLAHHAVRAERWDRAARYLHQAGERAYAHARYRAAAAFYEEAVAALARLGAAADHGLEVDACLGLWSARTSFGRHDGSRELGEKAEGLARALGDGPRLAQVQLRRAQAVAFTCVMPGTLESAIEQAREAFERAGPDDLRTRSYACFIVGHALLDLGRIGEAVEELDAGIDLFAHADPRGGEAGLAFPIYVSLGAWRAEAHAALGEFDRALASANDALRMATEIRHASSLAVADMFLGAVHAARGDLGAAIPPLERGLAIAAEHDLHMGMVRAAANLARALAVLGERDRALECLARARARSAEAGVAHHGPATGYGAVTAAAYLAAGCPADAAGEIEQGLAAAAALGARGRRAPLLRLRAELLADRDAAAARERLGEARALADELGLRPEAAHCQLGLAALCRRTGDAAGAERHLGAAIAMYRGMRMTHWAEQAERGTRER